MELVTDCRICFSNKLIEVLDLGTQAFGGIFPKSRTEEVPTGPLKLIKCADCGLVQLGHNYDSSILYGENYGYRSGLNLSMVNHLCDIVRHAKHLKTLRPMDIVIDIGSNDGTLLAQYQDSMVRRIGIDPTISKFEKYYSERIHTIENFFSAEEVLQYTRGEKAKIITSIAMFYDLERPVDFVHDIGKVLDDDGIWIFEQSYLPSMIQSNSYDTVCHEHLEYYNLQQIRNMLHSSGMKIVDVNFNNVNGGSFEVVAAKSISGYSTCENLPILLSLEKEKAADNLASFDRFKTSIFKEKTKLATLLWETKFNGELVLGYGASTKGNVLLQYSNIDENLLPCIAEVNEDKFGCFTPGTGIPIVSEDEAKSLNPAYFLVLPWHFRDNIIEREQEFLKNGGHLIFPLPTLEIV